ncbi:MAG: carbamoyl-phosphate synthase large subunit [Rhodospirillales bacterium]|nr:carbamoyl-phosphate synthase large subunit [Rhodospirillales bacterium]
MPKRSDLHSIMIVGAGPIVIGQACEFDYSGAQACKALKEEGYRVILVNSNPATIMTDPGLADATYIEPITADVVARILEKERPDAILPTMGGQTALNVGMELDKNGILKTLGIEMIGAEAEAIDKAEDRERFRSAMERIGIASPKARMVESYEEALKALDLIDLPAVIRPSFTLGGTGGGIAYNLEEFSEIVKGGLAASPVGSVLVEQSVLGWKEFEMEVVRDRADNCIIVCSIENIDPMGVHTGDSVTVAPALTLTDKEYQLLRNASIACLREIGVDTGGSNVQFAINPENGEIVVIEMNPRVSRSSALASKATGFPIAKIAAKLAVGYYLDELLNDITKVTPASFEPTIDYIVIKMPRFTFEKFKGAEPALTTSMKSVGEAMSIGRTFPEALQKALRSLETGQAGLDEIEIPDARREDGSIDRDAVAAHLAKPLPARILAIAQAFRHGLSLERIQQVTHFDPWFLRHIEALVHEETDLCQRGLPDRKVELRRLKGLGFSDKRLAALTDLSETAVAERRASLGVHPVYKRIDTCAAEFPSDTSYMYSTYEGDGVLEPECEADPSARTKIMILGGGPNRIGQGIEFDYCCVHAAYALKEIGYETIMVNCNPETVSTDYDTSDRLYFEPLTDEDVIEIARREQQNGTLKGVIVQYGGQTPLKLAAALEAAQIPILGTPVDAIDLAEDRERFQQLIETLGLKQPPNGTATSLNQARAVAERIGYPLLLRPSYVLGGRAMEIVHDAAQLQRYMQQAVQVSGSNPVLVDGYLSDAIEVDVDALADGESVRIAGIMEHIEEAGIHSGDSACALPPFSLNREALDEIARQTEALAKSLGVRGLMNTQYAVRDGSIYVLEVNPRASRTVPFVAKAIGRPLAKLAARVMAGEKLAELLPEIRIDNGHVAVKEAVFPFARFPGVDVVLGPEMKSTGEVMGLDRDFPSAFLKSQLGAGNDLPQRGGVFVSVKNGDKEAILPLAYALNALNFSLVATSGTARALETAGLTVTTVKKVREGRPHVVDLMKSGGIQLVINTSEGARSIADSFSIRRQALMDRIPYYTTVRGAQAAILALEAREKGVLEVAPLQSYFAGLF